VKEWMKLNKGNFPREVTTKEYEWQWYKPECGGWTQCAWDTVIIFLNLWKGTVTREFRFREVKSKPRNAVYRRRGGEIFKRSPDPTFEEIKEAHKYSMDITKDTVGFITESYSEALYNAVIFLLDLVEDKDE